MSGQTFRDALAEEEAAERAIYNGDAEPYKALWSHTDQVTLFGAFGPCKTGWAELSRTFDWVAHRYQGGTVTQEYEAIIEAGEVAYTVALEHGRVALDGKDQRPQNDPGHADLQAPGRAVATRASPRRLRSARREPASRWLRCTRQSQLGSVTGLPVPCHGCPDQGRTVLVRDMLDVGARSVSTSHVLGRRPERPQLLEMRAEDDAHLLPTRG